MNSKLWLWVLCGGVVAYFAHRTMQWADSHNPKRPYGEALRLALTHPFSGPDTMADEWLKNKVSTASAGDGTGKSGPTIATFTPADKAFAYDVNAKRRATAVRVT